MRERWISRLLGLALVSSVLSVAACERSETPAVTPPPQRLHVLAAVSLTSVLTELGKRYEARTNGQTQVQFNFASSGTLARQIEAGARADVFVSASPKWMDHLVAKKLVVPDSRRIVAFNRLVLIASPGTAPPHPLEGSMPEAWRDKRWVIGDPAHMPAGEYAQAALRELGWWEHVSAHAILAVNVRMAVRYVELGAADLGIVFASDAQNNAKVDIVGTFPAASHPPIIFPAGLIVQARPGAQAWLEYLTSPEAREVFRAAGFTVAEP